MRHLVFLLVAASLCVRADEPQLAIINAVVSTSEDGPPVAEDYHFSPGDYLYFTFEIAGFAIQTENQGQLRKISLSYQIAPQDNRGRPLAEATTGDISTSLSPEDKNWVPKRRTSFLLPSFVAAGSFHVHVITKDAFGKTTAERDIPFAMGGVTLTPADTITIENFRFLRREDDAQSLELPAYAAGDTVYARFEMTGFKIGEDNRCRVEYGVTVLDPNGKAFIKNPAAARLEQGGFYPPQFVPGELALQMGKTNAPGTYTVIVEARDLIAKQTFQLKQTFSIE